MREALNSPRVVLLELTPEVAVASARLQWQHRDPADRLIIATTILHGAQLVTKDETIRAFAPTRVVW
jgi:PIN domain nuclease of toxin-antitoxin system